MKHKILQNSEFLKCVDFALIKAAGILQKSSWQAELCKAIHIIGKKKQTLQWYGIRANSSPRQTFLFDHTNLSIQEI